MQSGMPQLPAVSDYRTSVFLSVITIALGLAVPGAHAAAPVDQSSQSRCIAIVSPQLDGTPGSASDASNGVRDLIASYLRGPSMRTILLDAKLPSMAAEEAKQKGCEPLLITSVHRKSGGHSIMKAFSQAAGTASWNLPYGGGSAASAVARAGTTAGLQTVSSLAQSTKAKDEISFEYRLQSADGQIEFGPKTERRTAKSDGEDLLTPVVAHVAETIVAQSAAPHATPSSAKRKDTGDDYDSAGAVRYLDDLKTCTPYTWKYPNPFVPGFTDQDIIRGKRGDKCQVTYLMPNDLKADCEHSAATIKQMTSESAYEQARSGEYTASFHLSSNADSPFNHECHLFQGSKELPLGGQ